MISKLYSLGIASLLTIVANGVLTAAAPSSDGLVMLWNFDGSLDDTAGASKDVLASHDGKARFVSTDVPGIVDGAVALGIAPDDAQYFVAQNSDDVRLGPSYTIEAWIHPTHLGEWNRLVLQWGGPGKYAYHLAIHKGQLSLAHCQADGKIVFAEGGRVMASQLQHIVAVAARNDQTPTTSTLTVYLNGRPVGNAAFDGTIHRQTTESLGLGDSAGIPNQGSRFRGYVDEIAIWNRALSAEQIKARYGAPARAKAMRQFELARKKAEQERIKAENARRATSLAQFKKLGVEEIVFAERGYGRDIGGHYYANFGYSCGDPNVWFHSANGAKLTKLNLHTGELTALVDDPGGSIRDPQVHYDAKKVLFSYRKGGTHHYNLYEINIDGTSLRQLTAGQWDDIEPTYVPDGGIVFCSSRCKRYIGCWLAQSAILHRCEGDGSNIRMLSSGAFTENTPSVLPDGRILYTRWEYVNRDPVSFHHLWVMNPDGAAQAVYFGNMRPGGVFIDAVPIPGTDQVVMINSPDHGRNEHVGHVALVTDKNGPNAAGLALIIVERTDLRFCTS